MSLLRHDSCPIVTVLTFTCNRNFIKKVNLVFKVFFSFAANSKLKVWTVTGGHFNEVVEVTEVGALWKRWDVNIVSPQEYQVRLV